MRIKTTPRNQQSQAPESLVIRVSEFKVDANDTATAVVGVTYPLREKVEVALTDTGVHAENGSRKSIQELRSGFKYGRDFFKLEEGAVVSFNKAYKQQDGSYKATWTDVLAYNAEDVKATLVHGACLARLYTPQNTKNTILQLRKELAPHTPPDKLADEVEKALPLKTQRHRGVIQRFEPNHIMQGEDGASLGSTLQEYLGQERFLQREHSDGQVSREQMSPGFIVRALNGAGEVVDYADIPNYKFFDGTKKMGIAEQVEHVLGEIQKLKTDPERVIDILPYAELPISPLALQCGTGNKMAAFRKANTACHTHSEDGVHEVFAFPATLKMSMDSMWVSNIAADFRPENSIDPVLIAQSGMLKAAPGLDAEQVEETHSVPTPAAQELHSQDSSTVARPEAQDVDETSEAEDTSPHPGR